MKGLGRGCVVAFGLACAPPPEVQLTGDDTDQEAEAATIAILYPPDGATDIGLEADGSLQITVVVDINGLEFVPANTSNEDIPGEGHWHLDVNNGYVGPAANLFWEFKANPGVFSPGQAMSIEVELVGNTHIGFTPPIVDVVEFNVAQPL